MSTQNKILRMAATIAVTFLLCTATADAAEEGFTALFNGENLDGWIGATKGYLVEDGTLVCPQKGGGKLFTESQYSNFVFRFEFQLTAGANNGLGIRAPMGGDAAYSGMELQILDNTAEKYAKLKPYQYHGSVYGIAPAKRGFLKPVGEWNAQEVRCQGRNITVILNGETIVDVNLTKSRRGEKRLTAETIPACPG